MKATMVDNIIGALTLLGVVLLSWLSFRLAKRKPRQGGKPSEIGADGGALDKARDCIEADSKARDTAVQAALKGNDPASALADLGNRRRNR